MFGFYDRPYLSEHHSWNRRWAETLLRIAERDGKLDAPAAVKAREVLASYEQEKAA